MLSCTVLLQGDVGEAGEVGRRGEPGARGETGSRGAVVGTVFTLSACNVQHHGCK